MSGQSQRQIDPLNTSSFALFAPAEQGEESYNTLTSNDNQNILDLERSITNDHTRRPLAFRRRFGIERLLYKNENMKRVLEKPTTELAAINRDYQALTLRMEKQWRAIYLSLIDAGYSEEEAKRRADEYIAPLIIAETKLIKARHPFALGGKKGKDDLMEKLFARLKGAKKATEGTQQE
jgi:hypothetical protein